MTSLTGNPRANSGAVQSNAFTLIELILLMAILTVAAAIITPMLSKFIGGRTEQVEAERLLSLTHYGQSRAVAEGVPTMLWVNAKNGTYGLQLETGYTDSDPKAQDFLVDGALRLGVVQSNHQTTTTRNASKLPAIHFMPDGTISSVSVAAISLQDRDNRTLWIAQTANGLSYEIQDQTSYRRR